jgi:histidinol dehydrogenase
LEEEYEGVVKEIINNVKTRGDEALVEYTNRFDKVGVTSAGELEIPYEQLEEAYKTLPSDVREALEFAAERIKKFHEKQLEESFIAEEPEGIILGQKVLPLERVGVYVPGGKAQYPSTVLMNVIPAKVAGVGEIVMVSPNPSAVTLAAAYIAGVDRVFKIGGAQAVAALAYGTQTVPKVDKIVGPGNIYVALAKKLLYGVVDIDMVAGPSEILVIADRSANPSWVAADLLSQAEHDELAGPFCVTDSLDLALKVRDEVERQLSELDRREIAQKSVENWGTIFVVEDMDRACELANLIAPEHLEVFTRNPWELLPKIRNAGAIFLGEYTTEPLGDYVLGPNHTLPTGGTARFYSPLGVYDFVKRSSILYVSKGGFDKVKDAAKILATREGLTAHRRAIEIREEG